MFLHQHEVYQSQTTPADEIIDMPAREKLSVIFARYGLRPEPIIGVSVQHLSGVVIGVQQATAPAPLFFTLEITERLVAELIRAGYGKVALPIRGEIDKARHAS